MSIPKRRKSHGKTRKGRSHQALKKVNPSTCPKCKETKLSHQVCSNCGYYGEKNILDIEAKKVKRAKREKKKKQEREQEK